MEIKRDRIGNNLFLNQQIYISKILERFYMFGAKSVSLLLVNHYKTVNKTITKV